MGKIYYMMGKSSSGKDTLFKEIKRRIPGLRTVTLYTTRPVREGEKNGVEYFFVTADTLDMYVQEGKVVELRTYNTIHGAWKYATIDDGQVDLKICDYLMMGTLESYGKIRDYYGAENVVPVYVEVEDGERLARALARERQQDHPRYAELCRRFLADTEDFSEEHLREAGITRRYYNDDIDKCLEEIVEDIQYGKF